MGTSYSFRSLAEVKPGDHMCYLSETEEERWALITSYTREGLARQERVLYVAGAENPEAVFSTLRDGGVDVDPRLASGQLGVLTTDDVKSMVGTPSPDGMIALLRTETERALAQGYTALRLAADMYWILDALGSFERLMEYESKLNTFFAGSDCLSLCWYDRQRFDSALLLNVLATHPTAIVGTAVYDNFYYVALTQPAGRDRPAGAVQYWLDNLAARKGMEEALVRSKHYAESLIETANVMIIGFDADGTIRVFNEAAEKITGYVASDLRDKNWFEVLVPRDKYPHVWETFATTKGSGQLPKTFESPILTKSGEERFISWRSSEVLEDGKTLSTISFGMDITERKQAEEMFRTLADNSPVGIYIVQAGKFAFANPQFQKHTGYSESDLLGLDSLTLVFPDDRDSVRENAAKMLSGDRSVPYEFRVVNSAGETKWVMETVAPIQYMGRRAALGNFVDVTERKHQEQKLAYLATHDPLTGLPNRRSLEEAISRAVPRARRGVSSTLLFLDVDNFKLVNDTLGHIAGDQVLVALTRLLQAKLRVEDLVARLGGDEFAVLLEGTDVEGAHIVAERMRQAVEEYAFSLDGLSFNLSLSIGMVAVDGRQPPVVLLAQADAAMYRAKDDGRNKIVLYRPEEDGMARLSEANRLVARLKDALREGQFVLYYQPVVRLATGQIEHYEALVRLRGQVGEVVLPGAFIPAAERFGLMPQLTRWVVHEVIRTLARCPDVQISVNLSGLDLSDETLAEFIEKRLKEHGVAPERLRFEITETAVIKDLVLAERWISRLRSLGCLFALDDFGTGFVSFVYLRDLPVDLLKIDGSFIRTLASDPAQRVLVQAMQMLSRAQGKDTVAEFVENEAVAQVLQEIGITFGQGYYFGKPSPELPGRNVHSTSRHPTNDVRRERGSSAV